MFSIYTHKELLDHLGLKSPPPIPVNVCGADINWHVGYCNTPTLNVYFNRAGNIPDGLAFPHKCLKDSLYVGENDEGFVHFLYHNGRPEKQQGFAGRSFSITMHNGAPKTLIGPWSSRASAVPSYGGPACMDVHYGVNRCQYFGLAVTIPLALALMKVFIPDARLTLVDDFTPYKPTKTWEIMKKSWDTPKSVYNKKDQ